tara:strand:+ start:2185 stop:2646 length:462 start_codon:yes stop_codon:yes gene_type:complete
MSRNGTGFYSGQDGRLIIADTAAVKVRSWSFTANQSVLETVSLEDTDRTLIPGIRSVTGSCSLYYYQATVGDDTDVTTLLNNLITANSGKGGEQGGGTKDTVKFELRILDGNHNRSITFYAYITSLSMTSSVGEVLSADVSFEVSGAVTGLDF